MSENSHSIWEMKSGPQSKVPPVLTRQEWSNASIFISSDHETSKLRNLVTVIALKRNPLEMPQSCLVLTAKPRKSAKLEERFSQSREQAPGASRPASNRSDSVTLQLAFLKSSLSSHVRCLIKQREAPVLILVPRRSICASYLMTQFTQKSNQRFQEEKKKNKKACQVCILPFPPKNH